MNDKKWRIALIGLGRQTLNDHAPAILRRRDTEIVFASDVDEKARERFQAALPNINAKISADYHDLIDEKVDCVIIAIPHHEYAAACEFLCKQKIPFMKEKPLSRTLDEAIDFAEIPDFHKYCLPALNVDLIPYMLI